MFTNKILYKFGKGFFGGIFIISLIQLIITFLSTAGMFLSAILTRMMISGKESLYFSSPYEVIWIMLVLIIVRLLLVSPKDILSEKLGAKIKNNIRAMVLQKLFDCGPSYMTEARTGSMTSMVTFRVEWIRKYYIEYLPIAISALVNLVLVLTFMFKIDFLTSLVISISCLLMVLAPFAFEDTMKKRGRKEWQASDNYASECLDAIQGLSSLKSFNANKRELKKIKFEGERFRTAVMKHLIVTIIEGTIMEFFARLAGSLAVALAAYQLYSGNIGPVDLLYLFYMSLAAVMPMFGLIGAWHLGFAGVSASESLEEFLKLKTDFPLYSENKGYKTYEELNRDLRIENKNPWQENDPEGFDGHIVFDHVSFSYGDEMVLKDVSFTIKNKSFTAIIGPSGSGKSTIAKLLAGYYKLNEGRILIGGKELKPESSLKLRGYIASVWQDPHIYYGSIKENLLVAKADASREEILSSLERVNMKDFCLSLENGLDTNMGEEGLRFSGGERKRIAIARCFLRNRPILIFDEATSSLDRKNEILVQKSFEDLKEGRTSLVIAHRLSTIMKADQIIILDKGRIVAVGKHKDLLKTDIYRKLMGKQLESEVIISE